MNQSTTTPEHEAIDCLKCGAKKSITKSRFQAFPSTPEFSSGYFVSTCEQCGKLPEITIKQDSQSNLPPCCNSIF